MKQNTCADPGIFRSTVPGWEGSVCCQVGRSSGRRLVFNSGQAEETIVVGNPNRKKMHIFGFVGIFEYIC